MSLQLVVAITLNVSVVDYVSFKSKVKIRQSRINETHNSRHLLRILWKLVHLDLIWMNGISNNFISSRDCNRWCKLNKILEKFLDKKNIVQVFLYFKKIVYQYIVLVNILKINIKHIGCTKTYLLTIFTEISYSTTVGMSRAYLNSLVSILFLVKVMAPE